LRGDVVGDVPHPDEALVVDHDLAGPIDHEDAVGCGLERATQERSEVFVTRRATLLG
jgi:hypothetical protein